MEILMKMTQKHKLKSSCPLRWLLPDETGHSSPVWTLNCQPKLSQCWHMHLKGPFGGSLVFSGDPAPPPEDSGRRSRGPSPGPPLSRTAPGRLEQLDQLEEDEDHTHLKKVRSVSAEWTLSFLHGFSAQLRPLHLVSRQTLCLEVAIVPILHLLYLSSCSMTENARLKQSCTLCFCFR